jgi:hypothetical protein
MVEEERRHGWAWRNRDNSNVRKGLPLSNAPSEIRYALLRSPVESSQNAGFLCPCAGDVYDDASLIGLDHSPDGDTRHLERVLEVYS